jgi:hypothetical protein
VGQAISDNLWNRCGGRLFLRVCGNIVGQAVFESLWDRLSAGRSDSL